MGGGHMHRPENQQRGVLKYAHHFLQKHWELVIYGVVGVCTTVINIVVFQILSEKVLNLFWSNASAFVIAVLFAYAANSLIVFHAPFSFRSFLQFWGMRIVSLAIDMGGLFVLIAVGMDKLAAKIFVNVAVVIANYLFSKLVIFKKGKGRKNGD